LFAVGSHVGQMFVVLLLAVLAAVVFLVLFVSCSHYYCVVCLLLWWRYFVVFGVGSNHNQSKIVTPPVQEKERIAQKIVKSHRETIDVRAHTAASTSTPFFYHVV
jgi:hypothetical protein